MNALIALALFGGGVYYLLKGTVRPPTRWQVDSILAGEDPDEGWIQRKVTAIEWREETFLKVNNTIYKAQWWYRINELWELPETYTSGEWLPEQFLESAVVG